MASTLLKKLSLMNAPATAAPRPAAHVSIREWSCPADERIYHLSQDALLLMGMSGGVFDPERAAFIDTETTGLSGGAGTVAFLIGIGFVQKGRFTVKQYLMPDYSAEAEMLLEVSKELSRFAHAVHFNGRRFDMPLIRERCVMKRLEDPTKDLEQLDLLYPARSVWKLRAGSCRLSHLESAVLGMPERDDIPGSEIPARYFDCVKSGDMSGLEDVIDHNRQDIATLMTLLCVLCGMYERPDSVTEQLDIYSLGRAFERRGELKLARGLYLKASKPRPVRSAQDLKNEKYAGEANWHLYLLERRRGDWQACHETLSNMLRRNQMPLAAHMELCKLYEHRLRRYGDALNECMILMHSADSKDRPLLAKRYDRIKSKLEKYGG